MNLTDLYQLTMSYGYWKNNLHNQETVFHLFFRKAPFGQRYAIAAGLAEVVDFLDNFGYSKEDIEYLATILGKDGKPLFEKEFLTYLQNMKFACTVDAVAEGERVYAHEPIIRIQGPIIQCQLLETILLNLINFQTLIATKAALVVAAATTDCRVAEFGLRRAQGPDGGLSASRAAYIGGCHFTSNVLAGQLWGIPVAGTHAHSWVMSFSTELEAFRAYASAQPHNCTLLVDTYDPIQGIQNAITVSKEMRQYGGKLHAIRLDSGDLCELSKTARSMLDAAGATETMIMASNDLDEHKIKMLRSSGAAIDVWGVGTALVTGADQPALGGVYKLGAIRENGNWRSCMKISADIDKSTNPGILGIYRSDNLGRDIIYNHNCKFDKEPGDQLLISMFSNGHKNLSYPTRLSSARILAGQSTHNENDLDNYQVVIHETLQAEKEELHRLHQKS